MESIWIDESYESYVLLMKFPLCSSNSSGWKFTGIERSYNSSSNQCEHGIRHHFLYGNPRRTLAATVFMSSESRVSPFFADDLFVKFVKIRSFKSVKFMRPVVFRVVFRVVWCGQLCQAPQNPSASTKHATQLRITRLYACHAFPAIAPGSRWSSCFF